MSVSPLRLIFALVLIFSIGTVKPCVADWCNFENSSEIVIPAMEQVTSNGDSKGQALREMFGIQDTSAVDDPLLEQGLLISAAHENHRPTIVSQCDDIELAKWQVALGSGKFLGSAGVIATDFSPMGDLTFLANLDSIAARSLKTSRKSGMPMLGIQSSKSGPASTVLVSYKTVESEKIQPLWFHLNQSLLFANTNPDSVRNIAEPNPVTGAGPAGNRLGRITFRNGLAAWIIFVALVGLRRWRFKS